MAINMTDVIDSVDKNTDKIINSFLEYVSPKKRKIFWTQSLYN